jgi:hypothetical protein
MKLPARTSPRADQIRHRRTGQSHAAQQKTKGRKKRVVAPPLPPVMARAPIGGASRPAARGSQKGRRMYNVSLDASQGAEMRLPALPRIALSWRAISFLLAAFLAFALYNLWESPSFRIDAPQIEGLKRLSVNQVNSELGLTGEPVFILDAQVIETNLLTFFPEFSSAEVLIELSNTVTISVTERLPVLVWMQEEASYLVDKNGITFPLRGMSPGGSYPLIEAAGDPPEVILPDADPLTLRDTTISKITGAILPQLSPQDQVKPLLTPEMVEAILLVSEKAPDGAKLIYDPVHGLGWTDRRGWNVYLGNTQDVEIKLQVYLAIFEKLKADDTRPTMISVEYLHAPYYRLEESAEG